MPVLSPEQRIQQLESTVSSLISQVNELTRELQSTRTEREELQDDLGEMAQTHSDLAHDYGNRLSRIERRVDDVDGGDEEQYNDSS